MEVSLLQQGSGLMLYGMGTVFVFLSALVLCVNAMSYIILTFFPETEVKVQTRAAVGKASAAVIDPRHLAVIKAALEKHRSRKS